MPKETRHPDLRVVAWGPIRPEWCGESTVCVKAFGLSREPDGDESLVELGDQLQFHLVDGAWKPLW